MNCLVKTFVEGRSMKPSDCELTQILILEIDF